MNAYTHYKALGLDPSAPASVIKAAYKALALVYHPDKTLHLEPNQRAAYASTFRSIQTAYDVLSNPALKDAYDRKLNRETQLSRSSTPSSTSTSTCTTRTPAILLAHFQAEKAKRDEQDATLDLPGLRLTLSIWRDLAQERAKLGDPHGVHHCTHMIREYEEKLALREKEHEDWLAKMASPKTAVPRKTAAGKPATTSTLNSIKEAKRANERTNAKKAAAAEKRAQEQARHAELRAKEKARKEEVKKAEAEKKAADVRREKEKVRKLAAEKEEAEKARIAKARAKAAPKVVKTEKTKEAPRMEEEKTTVVKRDSLCGWCGDVHASVGEWKRCGLRAKEEEEMDELSFFKT
ncbi:DnaJ-domain-containing protein [Sporormia fimetaria CBS 119925]|uniref:DnaJ-domain-containing protein n=1 Tax=Sporormia fimetaria CBS 119925 TaxID=1340428 RepID=A0A6A6V362_9PLEO|nr:DnaJ-domain-containing protein [Sporormia fimetaria CBS 119925]